MLWLVHSLGRIKLTFSLLHFVLQVQTCLLLQVYIDFLLLHSNPWWWIDAQLKISQFCKIHPRGLQDRKEPRLSIISCSQPVLSNIKQINKSMQSGLSGSQFPNPKGKIPINVLPKMKPNTTEKNTLLPSHISSATCQRHLNKSMPCIFHHKIESSMGQQCLVSSKPVGLSMRQKHSSRCYTGS